MSVCELFDSPDVEMYFYGELDEVDRARLEVHLRGCGPCRQRLEDLDAIRRALASRPLVDAPAAADWSGFMYRLDQEIARSSESRNPGSLKPRNPGTSRLQSAPNWSARRLLALAALLALVTIGVVTTARLRTPQGTPVAAVNPRVNTETMGAVHPDHALREGSAEHLERSKLVVLGLATRDPRDRPGDWQYERALAGTLLADTRLYRQAAMQDGASDVERVMRDLETVLLEASMSDGKDRAALERVQRLIAKRDLVVKMQVMAAAGPAGN
jgi:hypothetical protein